MSWSLFSFDGRKKQILSNIITYVKVTAAGILGSQLFHQITYHHHLYQRIAADFANIAHAFAGTADLRTK
jgi:hypothetical protein